MSDAPKVSRYEATARGEAAMCQNCVPLSEDAFRNVAASGSKTIRLRYNTVYPSASPNPGRLLRFLKVKDITGSADRSGRTPRHRQNVFSAPFANLRKLHRR